MPNGPPDHGSGERFVFFRLVFFAAIKSILLILLCPLRCELFISLFLSLSLFLFRKWSCRTAANFGLWSRRGCGRRGRGRGGRGGRAAAPPRRPVVGRPLVASSGPNLLCSEESPTDADGRSGAGWPTDGVWTTRLMMMVQSGWKEGSRRCKSRSSRGRVTFDRPARPESFEFDDSGLVC